MSDNTKIEWSDATWNPIVGCSRISEGCDNCYAIPTVSRGASMGTEAHKALTVRTDEGLDWNGDINRAPDTTFLKPLHWKRPRKIFVNSLSDLFHPEVSDHLIAEVFAMMAIAEQHTFQVLTKRPQRMAQLIADDGYDNDSFAALVEEAIRKRHPSVPMDAEGDGYLLANWDHDGMRWPLPNVWLGVSIESDKYTWRADHLRNTPAATRFISAEPLLGPLPSLNLDQIDWLIVGGESGPGARPMNPQWIRDLRDNCEPCVFCNDSGWTEDQNWQPMDGDLREAHRIGETAFVRSEGDGLVPCGMCNFGNWSIERDDFKPESRPAFFFKQWGEWGPGPTNDQDHPAAPPWTNVARLGKKLTGRDLDGRTWDEFPQGTP